MFWKLYMFPSSGEKRGHLRVLCWVPPQPASPHLNTETYSETLRCLVILGNDVMYLSRVFHRAVAMAGRLTFS
jgi:hypothetical protein